MNEFQIENYKDAVENELIKLLPAETRESLNGLKVIALRNELKEAERRLAEAARIRKVIDEMWDFEKLKFNYMSTTECNNLTNTNIKKPLFLEFLEWVSSLLGI